MILEFDRNSAKHIVSPFCDGASGMDRTLEFEVKLTSSSLLTKYYDLSLYLHCRLRLATI
jgi:hypothetical protein